MVAITTVKTFSLNLLIVVNLSLLLFIVIFGLYTNGALFQMSHISLPFTETRMRELEHEDLSPKSETTALNSKASKVPRNQEADIPKTKKNKPNEPEYSELERQSNTGGAKRDDATVENHNMSARVIELAKMLKERLEHPKDRHPRKIKYQCEDIDYSKNSYVQRKPCFGAKCDKKFNRSFKDRVKDVLLSPQYQLSRSQLDTILSLNKNVPETDVIIVPAVSSNHYDEMQMMFKNLHETVYPSLRNFRVVLFDIGLSPKERQQTEKSCRCQVVTFTFDLFPSHVLDRHCYAWKPLIVRSLMDKARQLLIWQDASVRWRSQYMEMFDRARTLGLQVLLGGGDRVTANTLHETFEYMEETECLFEFVPEIANAVAVYKADVFNKLAVLTPWARCALESTCMCPQDPNIVRYCGQMKPLRCHSANMSLGHAVCERCHEGFSMDEQIVNSNGQVWHTQCFVCAQCFQPFPEGRFFEFEGRKYCEHDFCVLFAPSCARCGEFISGRVIKAMNASWHPECFRCFVCAKVLADEGFVKNQGRALCRDCNAAEKAKGLGKYVCFKCHSIIDGGHLKWKGEAFHPYHFNCHSCGIELKEDAREKDGELYCLRCHDKMGIPICGACRRPIEERVIHAMGKTWHVEHFVCAKCEKPFLGTRHYEKKGLAYCEIHYHQLFGNICFVCNNIINGDVFSAFNKAWCTNCFACSICDRKMNQKTKFFEFDQKPVCKNCYDKFPSELKKRLKKAYDEALKSGKAS